MNFVQRTTRWQRRLIPPAVVLSVVAIFPPALKPFMLPKVTAVVVIAISLSALAVVRAVWSRRVHVPASAIVVAVGAFVCASVASTIASPSLWTSLIGTNDRFSGLLPYLAYVVIFTAVLALIDEGLTEILSRTALATLGVAVSYGFLQFVGADPFDWVASAGAEWFSFFGNVNFSAAWTGAVVALALPTMASSDQPRKWRIYAGVLLPTTLVYVVLTGTSQGPIVALIALAWATLVLAFDRDSHIRRIVGGNSSLVVAAGGALTLLLALGAIAKWSFLRAQLSQALVERPDFWATAIRIFADHPTFGTGLSTYGQYFLAYRPVSHAVAYGGISSDSPHSVPLAMFANGGLLLGLAYVLMVVLIGVALVRGVIRGNAQDRRVLAGFGGVWLGYQAQALISIDVPPLAFLHWLSAGVIVAVASPPQWRTVALPGQAPQRQVDKRGRKQGPIEVPTSTRASLWMVSIVAIVSAWLALYPIRASMVAYAAVGRAERGEMRDAADWLETAAQLDPSEATYPGMRARVLQEAGWYDSGAEAAEEAARRDPGSVDHALFAAWLWDQAGEDATAARWYREAARRDPNNPGVHADVAAFFISQGSPAVAEEYVQRALELEDDNERALSLLAELNGQG